MASFIISTFMNCNVPEQSTRVYTSILLVDSGHNVRSRNMGHFGPVCLSEVGTNVRGPIARVRVVGRAPAATIVSKRGNVKRIVNCATVGVTVGGTGRCNVKVMTIEGSYRCNVTKCCAAVTAGTNYVNVANAGTHPSITPAFNIRNVFNAGPFAVNMPASRTFSFGFSYTASVARGNGIRCCREVNRRIRPNAVVTRSNSTIRNSTNITLGGVEGNATTLAALNNVNRSLTNCGNCNFTLTIRFFSSVLRSNTCNGALSNGSRGNGVEPCRLKR